MLRKLLSTIIATIFFLACSQAGFATSDDIAAATEIADTSYDDSSLGSSLETTPAASNADISSSPVDDLLVNTTDSEGNQTVSVSSDNFGMHGPLKIGATYSSGFGAIVNSQWLQALNYSNALALALDIGPDEYRLNATWGHAFNDHNRIKTSAEYLAQKMDFDFDSGTVTETIGQSALGFTYQYLFSRKLVRAFNLNAIYSKAQSKDLDLAYYVDASGNLMENYRRIAGGSDKGFSAGLDFLPTKSTLLGFDIDYDSVTYDEQYNDAADNLNPTGSHDESGIGATVRLQQIISNLLQLNLSASNRKPYNEYKAELNWLAHTAPNSRLEMSLNGASINGGSNTDDSGTNNDVRFGINVSYRWGPEAFDQHEIYTLQTTDTFSDLVSWTSAPAVHMDKVLAIVDQKTLKVLAPDVSGIDGKTIPRDLFPQFTSGYFNFAQDIGILDLTPFIKFGAATLKSVSAPDLAAYGLQVNLTNGGSTVTLTGTPTQIANGVPILITITNAGGLASTATFFLNISSVTPQVIIGVVPTFFVGETPAQVGSVKAADLFFGGDPITANNEAAVNAILNPHNLNATFTNPTAGANGSVIIQATGNVQIPNTGETVDIYIKTATQQSLPASFTLKIADRPVITPQAINVNLGSSITNKTIGTVNFNGSTPTADSLIINNVDFSKCFQNPLLGKTLDIVLLADNQTIQIRTGQVTNTLPSSNPCIVSGALQVKNQEGAISNAAPITLFITGQPTISFNNLSGTSIAAKGAAGGPLTIYNNPTGQMNAGINGTINPANLQIIFDTPVGTCFTLAPKFLLTPIDSQNVTFTINPAHPGTLIDNYKDDICTTTVHIVNDQGVASPTAPFTVQILQPPVITPPANPINAVVTQSVVNQNAGTVDFKGGTPGPVSLDGPAENNVTSFFTSPTLTLTGTQLNFSGATIDTDNANLPHENSDGSHTFVNALKVTTLEGLTAFQNLKVKFFGRPEITTQTSVPSVTSGTVLSGTNTLTLNTTVYNGLNDPNLAGAILTIDDTNNCFVAGSSPTATVVGKPNPGWSIVLNGGQIKTGLDAAGPCTFKITAQNSSGLLNTTYNPDIKINVTAGPPIINRPTTETVYAGQTFSTSDPLSFATVNWNGASATGSTVSLVDISKSTCFVSGSNPQVEWSKDTPTADCTSDNCHIKLTGGTIAQDAGTTSCTFDTKASSTGGQTTATVTLNYTSEAPNVNAIAIQPIYNNTSLTTYPQNIATVAWGKGSSGPSTTNPAVITDTNGCFDGKPPVPVINLVGTTYLVTINSGRTSVSRTPGVCTYTLAVTDNAANPNTTQTTLSVTLTSQPVITQITPSGNFFPGVTITSQYLSANVKWNASSTDPISASQYSLSIPTQPPVGPVNGGCFQTIPTSAQLSASGTITSPNQVLATGGKASTFTGSCSFTLQAAKTGVQGQPSQLAVSMRIGD